MLSHSTPPGLRAALAAAVGLLTLGAVGCSADAATNGQPGRIDVVAAFYPLQFLAEQVGGDAVTVTNLAKPGAEPHDLELSPKQVAQLANAKVVLYLKGFQPEVDKAVQQEAADAAFDVATVEPLREAEAGHGHEGEKPAATPTDETREDGGGDPHVWLDPTRLAKIADAVAERLAAADAGRAADYRSRAAVLRGKLEQLDKEYTEGLKTCQRREIVVSHAAFAYLTHRYDLEQVGITGLSPEVEPTPKRLAEVAGEAREHKATTIFFETLVSPKVAEAIAAEVGAKTAVLDPIEGLQPGSADDYLSVMRKNLATLRPALGCT